MNILFIVNHLSNSDGVSSHTYNLIKGLNKFTDFKIRIICCGGDSISKFKTLGIRVYTFPSFSHDRRSYTNYLFSFIILIWFVIKEKIDVIHSHNHYAASIAFKVSKILKVKTVQTNHGLFPETGRLKHYSADYLIAVNLHIKDYLIKNNLFPQDKIFVIRSGIELPDKREIAERKNKKLKFIAASRLIKEKGLDIYLKAVSFLSIELKQKSEFYFAGKGEYEKELLKLNEELKSGADFLGEVPNLKDELSSYDVFVMPTESESEGFPMTLIEAGMNKCLIISSDFYGLDSVFENEKDGLLFKIDNSQELADKISAVIKNFDDLFPMTEHFYNKIRDAFSFDKMVNKTIELYNKCLK